MIAGSYGPSTWYQANDTYEQQGLKLLTIDSQQEENYVAGTLNPPLEQRKWYVRWCLLQQLITLCVMSIV